ncbi:MAG: hypothetical protein OXF27_21010, partial [Acidobacteria bacterium]|nr:hypothetical protein [Acidobacteriota bacterium]
MNEVRLDPPQVPAPAGPLVGGARGGVFPPCAASRGKKKGAQSARDFSLAGRLAEGGRRGG